MNVAFLLLTVLSMLGRKVVRRRTSEDGADVVVVVLILRQEKYGFVRLRGAVANRLRMCIGLVPDDFGPKPPPRCLQGKRESPRHSDQVFRFESPGCRGADGHRAHPVLSVGRAIPPVAGRVGVADVQPDRAVVRQNAMELVEGPHDARDIVAKAVVSSCLRLDVIVPE